MGAAAGPNVVEDGLVLALDAGNTKSYDASGSIITYVGGTSDSDNSSSFTLSGLQSGDLVLYFSAEDAADVATPTGASWTAIPGLITQPDNDNGPNSGAFYVFATGTSVTASGLNTGDEHVRVMIAFRNVNSTNPFDVNATENSASGMPDPPSITPVTDNSMIVAVGLLDDEDIANSISPPTGYTTALNMDSQGGANDAGFGGATIMTAYKLLATAAAEDPANFTSSNVDGGTDPGKRISIALRRGTSSTWTDLSGNSNTGTLTNSPTYSSNDGGYIDFDGTNDYVDVSGSRTVSAATFLAWVRLDGDQNAWSGVIYSRGTNISGMGFYNDTEQIGYTWNDDSNSWLWQSGLYVPTQEWCMMVVTVTSSVATAYLCRSSGITSSTNNISHSSTILDSIEVGRDSHSSTRFFDGRISMAMVYNKALTAAEVLQNYTALKGRYGY